MQLNLSKEQLQSNNNLSSDTKCIAALDCRKRTHRKVNIKKRSLVRNITSLLMSFFHFCSFCHKCQKPLFYTLSLSSCISIRTSFGCVFFRHCIVKILANASAFTAFLPRIVAKTQHRKFFEPKII